MSALTDISDSETGPKEVEHQGSVRSLLEESGKIFKVFDLQDSGCVSYGIRTVDGRRFFLKTAVETTAIPPLRNASDFNTSVQCRHLARYYGAIETLDGPVLVYEWFDGEVLNSPEYAGGEGRKDPRSPHYRFTHLPFGKRLAVANAIYETHRIVEAAGWIAVDFYDGCIIYDFADEQWRFCDFDLYHRGPLVLERERNYGSSRFMAPEEFHRGSIIDRRTNVFTMGRTAWVFFADAGKTKQDWIGPLELYEVAAKATNDEPEKRYQTVADFSEAWNRACENAGLAR